MDFLALVRQAIMKMVTRNASKMFPSVLNITMTDPVKLALVI